MKRRFLKIAITLFALALLGIIDALDRWADRV